MASLSATITQSCQSGQGVLTLSEVSTAPGSTPTSYEWHIIHPITGVDYGGSFELNALPINAYPPDANGYQVRVIATSADGTQDNSSLRTFDIACATTTPPGGGGGGGGGTPVIGCTTPYALNYDADATQDSDPTACVFVRVEIPLSGLVAAHLPIPVIIRASPNAAAVASILVLYLERADTLAGPWQEFARLKQVCDASATVRFDLSEAAKSLLRLRPPVESGIDPNLSALLRARYEVLNGSTYAPMYAGPAGTCRALNAVVPPSSGATLTSASPYTELPDGAALWESVATYAEGVRSTLVVLPATGCPYRQFAWLNQAGAWDTGVFLGRPIHGTDQADPVQYRDGFGADRYAKRGTVRETLQVYSDKVDWPTFRLLRGVRDRVQVWERLASGNYVPVVVATESYPEYQEQTDKTYQVNFTVSYPAQLIQTQ